MRRLFKGYQILLLGDREFHSIKLARLVTVQAKLNLASGVSFFLQNIQSTKQRGFGKFNLVRYYKCKYREKLKLSG